MRHLKFYVILVLGTLLLLGSANMASAQVQPPVAEWVYGMGSALDDTGLQVAVDKNGNVYDGGQFQNIVDFDPGPGQFFLDAGASYGGYVRKVDKNGNLIWAFNPVGDSNSMVSVRKIRLDRWGNVYVAGYFKGNVDFDPGTGEFMLSSNPASNYTAGDGFVLKIDADANFIWAIELDALSSVRGAMVFAKDVAVDSSGNIFIAGMYGFKMDADPGQGTHILVGAQKSNMWDFFIIKLDNNLNFVWAYNNTGPRSNFIDTIAVDSSDNILFTGRNQDAVDMDPGPEQLILLQGYIIKMDTHGNIIWARGGAQAGGRIHPRHNAFVLDDEDNVYFHGNLGHTYDFDPGPGTFNLTSKAKDPFVWKLDRNGNFGWAVVVGGSTNDYACSIALDKSANVYCTGVFTGTADFDPGPGTFKLTSAGSNDIYVLKLDNGGNFNWAVRMGGSEYDYPQDIAVDGLGNPYVTGQFRGTVDFDPGEGIINKTSVGRTDIFLVKLRGVTNEPPVAICQDIEIAADNNCEAYITAADVDAGSYDPDEDEITLEIDKAELFGVGEHTVKLTVEDPDGESDYCYATVTVIDNTAPVPDAAELSTVTGQCSAEITTFPTATDNCSETTITGTTTDPLTYTEQGTYTVTWTFDDGRGNTAFQEQTVIVQDTTAPTITSISANPNTLWPANHKMVAVTVSVESEDNCAASPVSKIISVESNEPVNGNGDGDTSPDWEITGDLTLNLRAERSGKGSGRIYTITVECRDAVGNVSTGTVTVVVPKNKKK